MSESCITSSLSHGRPSGRTRQVLDSARRAKKRETDRQSQRTVRERTKTYISYLEKLVTALGQSKENGQFETLIQQLQKEREEKERLKDTMTSIGKLVRGVEISDCPKSEDAESTSSSLAVSATTDFKLYDEMYRVVASSRGSDTVLYGTSSMGELPIQLQVHQQSPGPLPSSLSLSSQLSPILNSGLGQTMPSLTMSVAPTISLPDELFTNDNDNMSIFSVVDNAINMVQELGASVISTNMLQDADIAIRAVLYGWVETEGWYTLDIGWQLLRQFDKCLFSTAGSVERLAILKLLRLKLRDNVGLGGESSHSLPPFMARRSPRSLSRQQTLVDYFAWPKFREFLVLKGGTYMTRENVEKFAASLQFYWPFDLQDVCLRNRHTCLYSFSGAFNERFQDIRWWTLTPEYFEQKRFLIGQMPVFEPSVERLFDKESPATTYYPSAVNADILIP
ncbi:hypothetical protein BGW36DRAFT_457370 [Talaromyces proteolyticus]|uniref:BZIP domain-containing protein n=1 Tax=Talaromyces proteolyticus TaxID=1131652 RepID=A0AAD4Q6T7_9EURO|nr:uncharacterized protein BGW36DRAFT_457370 [Talaromyces proteolyticus]KAH8706046.1 hypothetical protein BGW36DRAFT_457370 [Talaromyces proteolyticus]